MKTTRTLPITGYFDSTSAAAKIPDLAAAAYFSGQRFYDVACSAGKRLSLVLAPAASLALTACSRKFATDLESFNSTAKVSGAESLINSPLFMSAVVLAIVSVPIGLAVRHYWSQTERDKPSGKVTPFPAAKMKSSRVDAMKDFYDVAYTVTGYVPHDQFAVWESVSDRFLSYMVDVAGGVTLENMEFLYEDCYKVLDQMALTEEQIEQQYADVIAHSQYSAYQIHMMRVIRLQTLFYAVAKFANLGSGEDLTRFHLQELPKLIEASNANTRAFKHSVAKLEAALKILQSQYPV